jgi:23S rRNA pseudouridine2457 synthase
MQPNISRTLSYFLFYKPYGVLCQFSDGEGRTTLKNFGPFPEDVYPVGRLDMDSEGLVLLTNDGRLQHLLLEPKYKHPRTYLAQVERIPTEDALKQLRNGVIIEGKKTFPADAVVLTAEQDLPPREVPIRFRKNIPTAWLQVTLTEGRNRQVRKMTAAVGHPTLRLMRIKIGGLSIGTLQPGEHRELSSEEIAQLGTLKG